MKEIKGEMNTVEADEGSVSHGMDFYDSFRSSSVLKKETNLGIRDAVVERVIRITHVVDIASPTSSSEESSDEVLDGLVGKEENSSPGDVRKSNNGSKISSEDLSSSCTQSSIMNDVKESQFFFKSCLLMSIFQMKLVFLGIP